MTNLLLELKDYPYKRSIRVTTLKDWLKAYQFMFPDIASLIRNEILGKKLSPSQKSKIRSDFVEMIKQSYINHPSHYFSDIYRYLSPRVPNKAKFVLDMITNENWVNIFVCDKVSRLSRGYSDGQYYYATDNVELAFCSTNREKGYYNLEGELLTSQENFPIENIKTMISYILDSSTEVGNTVAFSEENSQFTTLQYNDHKIYLDSKNAFFIKNAQRIFLNKEDPISQPILLDSGDQKLIVSPISK